MTMLLPPAPILRLRPILTAFAVVLASVAAAPRAPAAAAAAVAPPGNKQVQATLLADVAAVKPGQPFTLGVLLKITPGWHVYWKNPGDSGAPTKVTWKLPHGWKAGDLQFPIPTRFEQPGNETIIGYEKEVLLTAQITPPNNQSSAGDKIPLAAEVSFLVCEQVCLPGKVELSLDLPVAEAARPANGEVFATWKDRFPNASQPSAVVSVSGTRYTVAAHVPGSARDVQWFPVPPDAVGVESPGIKADAPATTYSFALVPPLKQPAAMQFLVTFKDPNGKRQGVEFTVTLPAAQ